MGITVEQVTKTFRSKAALKSISFEIPDGSIAALIGENGAGKSTLLHILAALQRPDSGKIEIDGSPPSQQQKWLSKIGFVDQEASIMASMSLKRHSGVARSINVKWNEEFLLSALEELSIPTDCPAKVLSGGQRQAAATLLAVAKEPKTLLLDEPLAALDPLMRRTLLGILLAYAYDNKVTVLLSTHLLSDIERTCDHIVLLKHGTVTLSQRTEQIIDCHRWVPNLAENKNFLTQKQETSFFEIGGNLLVCSDNEALFEQMGAKSASFEEIILARMGDLFQPKTAAAERR